MNFLGGLGSGPRKIPEGQFTSVIYHLIKDNKHNEAISHLVIELQVRRRCTPHGAARAGARAALQRAAFNPASRTTRPTELPRQPCGPVAAGLLLLLQRAV